tara:strand:+ start:9118 stop:10293 length:1176 start_codon:yes stop_codon:yes gene_type:complete
MAGRFVPGLQIFKNKRKSIKMANVVKQTNTTFIDFDYIYNSEEDIGDLTKVVGGDVIINTVGDRINSAMWDTGDTILSTGEFHTSSAQSGSSGEYYLDVYRGNPQTDSTLAPQFSIAYGNYNGSGSSNLEGQSYGFTPTKAIYSQYAALLEDKNDSDTDSKFDINGSAKDSIYVINIGRNQLKESMDPGNWELKISGSNGTTIQLIDTLTGSGSNDQGDGPHNIISGSIAGGQSGITVYGKFYPKYGVMVLDQAAVSSSAGIVLDATDYCYDCSEGTAQTTMVNTNPVNLFNAIKGGAHFKARNTEHLHSRTYFCRIPSYVGNHSANPTFVAANSTDGTFKHASMIGNPKTYVTTVGLYDENNELLAVAKLSKPLLKSFQREALVRVRLEY